jgi:hypothetical protein
MVLDPFPHRVIDARLPTLPGQLQGGQHIGIKADRCWNLGGCSLRTAATSGQCRPDRGNPALADDNGIASGGGLR